MLPSWSLSRALKSVFRLSAPGRTAGHGPGRHGQGPNQRFQGQLPIGTGRHLSRGAESLPDVSAGRPKTEVVTASFPNL